MYPNGVWLNLVASLFFLDFIFASFNVEPFVVKSKIYYQRPLSLGFPPELPLEKVVDINTKFGIKLIIHGFTGSRTHISIRPLGNTYMATGSANVLLADWADAAALDYHSSRKAVSKVARFFGKMLEDFMLRLEIEPAEVHVIGHSLGAHIAGGIGQYFNGTLGRVTGLDPALPLFTPLSQDGLHANAAQFVDVIHTDFPVFGDITPRGTVDFYPNFGHTPQRGCEDIDIVTASKLIFEAYSCSHNRAVLLYAESIAIPKSFPAIPCDLNSIKQRNQRNCWQTTEKSVLSLEDAENTEENDENIYMGEYVLKSAYGFYYLETFDTPPYGMGFYSRY